MLHKFAGQPDGAVPVSSLTISPSGDLFGTTEEGGAHNMGTVFGLQPPQNPGDPWRERVLYSFGSSATDGVVPNAELLPANPGFYGVTREGGAHGFGTVFLVTPPAGGGTNWSETILYSFAGSGDAAFPSGGLVADQAGNLYGVTLLGGANNLGAVYQLSPPTTEGGSWTETVIFSFSGPDGTLPSAIAVRSNWRPLRNHRWRRLFAGGHRIQAYAAVRARCFLESERSLQLFRRQQDGGNPVAGVVIDNRADFLERPRPAAPAILSREALYFGSLRRQTKAINGQRPFFMRLVGLTVFARCHSWSGEAVLLRHYLLGRA